MRTLAKLGLLEQLVKEADISMEEHLKGLANEQQKLRELAAQRGVRVPMKRTPVDYNPATARYKYEMRPDTTNLRIGGKLPGPHPLQEAEILKSHNPYASSNLMRAKHRWLNPVKRFMGTTAGKAVGIGALGATGLGLYSYLKSRQTPQPENYQLSPEEQAMMQQQMYPKMGAENMRSVTIPRPPAVPQITSPGPTIANMPQIKRTPAATGGFAQVKQSPGQDALKEKKADMDASLGTLLAGGLGGGAGYMAGKHLVSPLIENKERDILREIAMKEQSLGRLRTMRKWTPIGIAALGAVALASVAALKARHDERSKIQQAQMGGRLVPYDPTGAGFGAADQVPMGAPYDRAYD